MTTTNPNKYSRRVFVKAGMALGGLVLCNSCSRSGNPAAAPPPATASPAALQSIPQPTGPMFRTVPVPQPPGFPNATPSVECAIYAAPYIWVAVLDTSNFAGAWLQRFSPDTLQPVGDPISLGDVDPIEMAYDSVSGNLWVTSFASSALSIVSVAAGTLLATIFSPNVTSPEGILFDGTGLMYVANYLTATPGTVSVFETARPFALVKTIDVGANPDWFAFDGNFVWVTNAAPSGGAPSVMLLRPGTGAIVDTIALPTDSLPLSIVYDGTAYMYVGYSDVQNAVAKIDVATRAIVATFPVPGPGDANIRGLLYQSDAGVKSIWTCNSFFDNVTRLDAANGAVLATYPTGSGTQPRVIISAGANMWIVNTAANFLTVVRPSQNSVLAPIYNLTL